MEKIVVRSMRVARRKSARKEADLSAAGECFFVGYAPQQHTESHLNAACRPPLDVVAEMSFQAIVKPYPAATIAAGAAKAIG